MNGKLKTSLLSSAYWIWDKSDPLGNHYYLRARRKFSVSGKHARAAAQTGASALAVTADAYYQVWINGVVLGHGPAKSPEGERAVDVYDIGRWLSAGENLVEFLVLSVGTGTMNYCLGEAGLLFEIRLPGGVIPSDSGTEVQRDPQRLKRTVRRWILPNIEEVNAETGSSKWHPATIVPKECKLIPRPVSLPWRIPVYPSRVVAHEIVRLPEFICSFCIKPYLVETDQIRRCNTYDTPAFIVTDLVSTKEQTITWLPAPGGVRWYFEGRLIGAANGWHREEPGTPRRMLRLKIGTNRLVGVHGNDHFPEIHLAAFARHPLEAKNPFGQGGFQIIRTTEEVVAQCGEYLPNDYEKVLSGPFPKMAPHDTRPQANFHDLVFNAEVLEEKEAASLQTSLGWRLPPARKGTAARLIFDLGAVHNGWLAFECCGRKGSRLIVSLAEAIAPGPPLTINWPGASNNSLSYHVRDGRQTFESFFAYGGRYLIIHHSGEEFVDLASLRVLSANCGNLPQGAFQSDHVTLNAIYGLCEQTLISATDDTLTDCPTYEAVNWNFDNRLATMADLVTMRNIALLRNTIEQFTRDPRYPGLVRSHTPSAWDNRIPALCFHWIILCREFFEHTGDTQFQKAVFPQIARGLKEAIEMVDSSGLLLWPADEKPWHIIDWQQGRDDAERPLISAEQALFVGALEAGAALAKNRRQAAHWHAIAARTRKAIHQKFWVAERDAHADSIHADGSLSPVSSQVSNASLALYGVGTSAWRKRLLRRLRESECDLLPYGSPMGLFCILEFFDACNEGEAIFDLILRKWSQMVEVGDKTAWEHFPEFEKKRFPTRSRCHPFATYILKYYCKYLLGIESVSIGMKEIRFRPRPPSMVNKVQGVFPTAHGPIRIDWKRKGRKIISTIETPKGVKQVS